MFESLEPTGAKKYHTAAYEQLLTTVIQRAHFHRLLHYAAFGVPGRTPTKFQYYTHDELETYMHRADLIICIGRGLAEDLRNSGGGLAHDVVLAPGAHSNVRVSAMLYSLARQADNSNIKIIFSGWTNDNLTHERVVSSVVDHSDLSEAKLLAEYAQALGVSKENVIDEGATDTVLSLLISFRHAKSNQHHVVIVAAKDHMPRMAWLVDNILPEDIEVCLVESDPMMSQDNFNASCERERVLLLPAMASLA